MKKKLKPRNPLVALVLQRGGAGRHERTFKAGRSRDKAALKVELKAGGRGKGGDWGESPERSAEGVAGSLFRAALRFQAGFPGKVWLPYGPLPRGPFQ